MDDSKQQWILLFVRIAALKRLHTKVVLCLIVILCS